MKIDLLGESIIEVFLIWCSIILASMVAIALLKVLLSFGISKIIIMPIYCILICIFVKHIWHIYIKGSAVNEWNI